MKMPEVEKRVTNKRKRKWQGDESVTAEMGSTYQVVRDRNERRRACRRDRQKNRERGERERV